MANAKAVYREAFIQWRRFGLQGFKEPLNVWVWTLHVSNVRPEGFQFVLKKRLRHCLLAPHW